MGKKILGFIVAMAVLPMICFAAVDEWQAFLRHQSEERAAFSKQLKQERDDFLKQHPDIAAKLEQKAKEARARAAARAAARQSGAQQTKPQPPDLVNRPPKGVGAPVKPGK